MANNEQTDIRNLIEQSILGILLLHSELIADCNLLKAHFKDLLHQQIYATLTESHSKKEATDILCIADKIGNQHLTYLAECAKNAPTKTNFAHYEGLLVEQSLLTDFGALGIRLVELSKNPDSQPATELLTEIETHYLTLLDKRPLNTSNYTPVGDIAPVVVQAIGDQFDSPTSHTGLLTGYSKLDDLTNGLGKSDLIILAARPGTGKTTLALNIAMNAVRNDEAVLIFSLEMSQEQLVYKIISSMSGITQNALKRGTLTDAEWSRLSQAMITLDKSKLVISEGNEMTPSSIRAVAKKWAADVQTPGLIVIDYLQLMRVPSLYHSKVAEVTEISRALKLLAKEFKLPVIALSQLSRAVEQRQDKRPYLSDLRDSGSVEQDADIVMMMYRESYYDKSKENGHTELILAKHRHGETGTVHLNFNAALSKFEDWKEVMSW